MESFLYDEFFAIESRHWWPVGMRRIFRSLLGRALDGRPDAQMLDVGCGTGIALEEFARFGRVVGLDLARAAVEYSRRRNPKVRLVQGDLTALPFTAASMDVVLAFDVIEHLEDDRAGLKEVVRVLKAGGIALINVPAFPSLWGGKDVANHHYRRYTRRTLTAALEDAQLTVERLTYTNATCFPAIWAWRQIERTARIPWNDKAEFHPRPLVNRALLGVLGVEERVLRSVDLPFGTSLTCVARNPGSTATSPNRNP